MAKSLPCELTIDYDGLPKIKKENTYRFMSTVINNLQSAFGQKWLKRNLQNSTADLEKLTSGYQINKAADDASGLAISEKMKAQIKALDTAAANADDGISLVQTAEGYLEEIQAMLTRSVELSLKAANGILTDGALPAKHGTISQYEEMLLATKDDERYLFDETSKYGGDRAAIELEFRELKEEMDRISKTANFNNILLFDGSLADSGKTEYRDVVVGKKPATEIPETTPPVTFTIPGARPTYVAPIDPATTTIPIGEKAATEVAKNSADITIPIGSAAPTEVAKNSPDLVLIPAASTPPTVTYDAPGVVDKSYDYTIPSGTNMNPLTTDHSESASDENKRYTTVIDVSLTLEGNNAGATKYISSGITPTITDNHGTVNIDTDKPITINGNHGTINVYDGSWVEINGENNGTINLYGFGATFDTAFDNTGGTVNMYTSSVELANAVNTSDPRLEVFNTVFNGTKSGDNFSYDLSGIRDTEDYYSTSYGGEINYKLDPADLQVDGYVLSYEDNGGNTVYDINEAYKLNYTPIEGFVRTVPKSGSAEMEWIANKFSSVSKYNTMEDYERKYLFDLMKSDWLPSGEGVTVPRAEIDGFKSNIVSLMSNSDGSLKTTLTTSEIASITSELDSIKSSFETAAGSAKVTVPTSGTAEIDWMIAAFADEAAFRALTNEERLYMLGLMRDVDWFPEGVGVTSGDWISVVRGYTGTLSSRLASAINTDGSVKDTTRLSNMSDLANRIKTKFLDAAPKIPERESDPIPTSGTAELDWLLDAFSSDTAFRALENEERLYIKGLMDDSTWYPEGDGVTMAGGDEITVAALKANISSYLDYAINADGSVKDISYREGMSTFANTIKNLFLGSAPKVPAGYSDPIPTSGTAELDWLLDAFADETAFTALSNEERLYIAGLINDHDWYPEGDGVTLDTAAKIRIVVNKSTIQGQLNYVMKADGSEDIMDPAILEVISDEVNSMKSTLLDAVPALPGTTKTIPTSGDAAFDYLEGIFSSAATYEALSTAEKDAVKKIFDDNTLGIDGSMSDGAADLLENFAYFDSFTKEAALSTILTNLDTEKDKLLAAQPPIDDVRKMAFTTELGGKGLELQIGETSRQADRLVVNIDQIDSNTLGLSDLSLLTVDGANEALLPIRLAINKISDQRARLGAYQNRLEYTIDNLNTASENISEANSRIRDTDIAKQQSKFVANQVLVQTASRTVQLSNENASQVLGLIQ
jgi:flagellin-like hook-associated protein FlgL